MSEWRRHASPCGGALVLTWQDEWPGAGWGLLDSFGRPKAPLRALRRVLAPTAILLIDEGLAGLRIHAVHDGAEAFAGRLSLRVFNQSGGVIETVEQELQLEPRGSLELSAEALLGGFRDITRAYRFGPPAHDVVAVELRDQDAQLVADACYLPSGPARPCLPDLGLGAHASQVGERDWELSVSTRLFAHYVALDIPGFESSDGWFHLLPGQRRSLTLRADLPAGRPSGSVRALNGPSVPITAEKGG
jgi:beta-mannosidase